MKYKTISTERIQSRPYETTSFDRVEFSLKDDNLSIEEDADSCNPYEHTPLNRPADKRPAKRDLRKLSEWIKATRAVEEKKARGED